MLRWVKFHDTDDLIQLDFTNKVRQNLYPLDAALYTIDQIVNNYPEPYTLLLSGGVDSQAMLYAWHKSGKNFKTLSAVYNHSLNENDLSYLRGFAHSLGVNINYKNFDLFNFLDNEFPSYVTKYKCGSPQICTIMKIAEMGFPGTVISSGNYIESGTTVRMGKNLCGLLRFSRIHKTFIPFFFMETPEIAYSFTDHYDDIFTNMDSYQVKVELYRRAGFPVVEQPFKMTGYEDVKEYCDKHMADRVSRVDKMVQGFFNSNRVFDILYRNKYENKYKRTLFLITGK